MPMNKLSGLTQGLPANSIIAESHCGGTWVGFPAYEIYSAVC